MFNQIVCQQRAGRTLRAIRGDNQEKALKVLKSELATLDRIIAQALSQKEITAALAPKHDETTDGEEIKPTTPQQQPKNIAPSQSSKEQEDKSSLVAGPQHQYKSVHPLRSTLRAIGL